MRCSLRMPRVCPAGVTTHSSSGSCTGLSSWMMRTWFSPEALVVSAGAKRWWELVFQRHCTSALSSNLIPTAGGARTGMDWSSMKRVLKGRNPSPKGDSRSCLTHIEGDRCAHPLTWHRSPCFSSSFFLKKRCFY